jgi:hypothetical protein
MMAVVTSCELGRLDRRRCWRPDEHDGAPPAVDVTQQLDDQVDDAKDSNSKIIIWG